jgi:hypothetical protein
LSIIIAFFITILPIEIVLHFFTIDAMTTTDDMTTTDVVTTTDDRQFEVGSFVGRTILKW